MNLEDERRHGTTEDNSPTLGIGEEYSRAVQRDQSDLSRLIPAIDAIHAAQDGNGAATLALAVLTRPDACGFERGLLLRLQGSGLLHGVAAAGNGAPDAELSTCVQTVWISADVVPGHPLLRLLAEARPRRLTVAQYADGPGAALESCLGAAPCLAIPTSIGAAANAVLLLSAPERGLPDDDARRAATEWIAHHLELALARIEAEQQRDAQAARQRLLPEIARAVLSATNLPDILTLVARAAVRAVGGAGALLWSYQEETRALELAVRFVGSGAEGLADWPPEVNELAWNCVRRGVAVVYDDLREAAGSDPGGPGEALAATVLPLTAFGELVGVLAVARSADVQAAGGSAASPQRFSQVEEDLLAVLAGYAAVAIKNARLADQTRHAEQREREVRGSLSCAERLAALGELATKAAHDLRNPAAAIRGYATKIDKGLPRSAPERELARVIVREARRIEAMLADQLQYARRAQPRLALRALNRIVQESVGSLREEMAARAVRLEEAYAEPLPELLLDVERIGQAIANVLRSAVESAGKGDTLRIETLLEAERVLLEIATTAERPAGEVVEELFVPFAASGTGQTGLGLPVAYQIVKEHGGEISVRNEGEWGAIFTISFPMEGNQERRRSPDRRGGRERRRRER